MGLTSALFSTLTGLNANQQQLNVIGNNIANANTTGFKSSQLNFESLFSQTLSNGSPPNANNGGTNPIQVGLGTADGGITTDFSNGSQQVTGVNTDLAIQGNGFFVLQGGTQQVYSRDGTFEMNSQNELVNANGLAVQGYGVDSSFNIIQGPLQNVTIPLGTLTLAQATNTITIGASLNGIGVVATTPAILTGSTQLYQYGGVGTTPSATAPTSATALSAIVDVNNNPLFTVGDTITVGGTLGSNAIAPKSFTVQATSTLGDFETFMTGALGINTTMSNGTAAPPGVTDIAGTNPNSAELQIVGNLGSLNNITLKPDDITVTGPGSSSNPLAFNAAATPANGESAFTTSSVVYDSLGSPVTVNITASLVAQNSQGTTWQFLVDSPSDQRGAATGGVGTNQSIGGGTLQFDTSGNLVSQTGTAIVIDRSGTGAVPQLQINLDFSNATALAGTTSALTMSPDGFATGKLQSFAINNDGTITGSFTNGEQQILGQIALATFANNQGLVNQGNNTFVPGANSGPAVISAPGQFSTGTLVAGALEMSNVNLSSQFVQLISASTGFSASSRIITTANQLLQDLLSATR